MVEVAVRPVEDVTVAEVGVPRGRAACAAGQRGKWSSRWAALGSRPGRERPERCGQPRAATAIIAAYAAALGAIPDGRAKRQGVALEQAAAAAILALRAADGSDTPLFDTAYPQGTQPGEYRFTLCRQPFPAARALINGS